MELKMSNKARANKSSNLMTQALFQRSTRSTHHLKNGCKWSKSKIIVPLSKWFRQRPQSNAPVLLWLTGCGLMGKNSDLIPCKSMHLNDEITWRDI